MQQHNGVATDSAGAISRYFAKANLPTQQETLGEIVTEILSDGRNLNRKSLCTKLLKRLEKASGPDEEKHYNALIGLLFESQERTASAER
jgi:probable RcsB/C two-component-system connector